MIVEFGCPLIYLKINPAERTSPLALFFGGEEINVKEFDPDWGTSSHRVQLMLKNPLATVLYFHNTVRAILNGPIQGGLFGDMNNYYVPIEYQRQGTPRFHIALWIKGATTPAEMKEKAKADPDFRTRLLNYISSVVTEMLPKEPRLTVEEKDRVQLGFINPVHDDDQVQG
jgi:Helitron helicase-like domain at N-terminus